MDETEKTGAEPKWPETKDEYELIQASIDHEYDLNDRRMNILLIFHGILLAAVGIMLPDSGVPISNVAFLMALLCTLLGISSATISLFALKAGVAQIARLKRDRERLIDEAGVRFRSEMPGAKLRSKAHRRALLPYFTYPALLFFVWFIGSLAIAVGLNRG